MLSLGVALAAVSPDVEVTDHKDVKANGGPADKAIRECSTNNHRQNEPAAAVNPKNPKIITSGSNDYCTVETTGGTRAGFCRSTDGGSHGLMVCCRGIRGISLPRARLRRCSSGASGRHATPCRSGKNMGISSTWATPSIGKSLRTAPGGSRATQ
jgi:hypothetical protein